MDDQLDIDNEPIFTQQFLRKQIIPTCAMTIIISLLASTIILSSALYIARNSPYNCGGTSLCIPQQVCTLPPHMSPPTICLFAPPKKGDKSWTVQHNVPYLSLMWPHVELGVGSENWYTIGETYTLSNFSRERDSFQWTVDDLYVRNTDGQRVPAHFTVWYNTSTDNLAQCLSTPGNIKKRKFTNAYSPYRYIGTTERCPQ